MLLRRWEQLVDVLALVDKKEREEDARMDQLEEMILTGQSVGPRPTRKKNKEEEKEAAEDVPATSSSSSSSLSS